MFHRSRSGGVCSSSSGSRYSVEETNSDEHAGRRAHAQTVPRLDLGWLHTGLSPPRLAAVAGFASVDDESSSSASISADEHDSGSDSGDSDLLGSAYDVSLDEAPGSRSRRASPTLIRADRSGPATVSLCDSWEPVNVVVAWPWIALAVAKFRRACR